MLTQEYPNLELAFTRSCNRNGALHLSSSQAAHTLVKRRAAQVGLKLKALAIELREPLCFAARSKTLGLTICLATEHILAQPDSFGKMKFQKRLVEVLLLYPTKIEQVLTTQDMYIPVTDSKSRIRTARHPPAWPPQTYPCWVAQVWTGKLPPGSGSRKLPLTSITINDALIYRHAA